MKAILSSLIFLFVVTTTFAGEKELILATKTGELSGTLSIPKKGKKFPVVLLIAGSGPTDRDGNQAMLKNNSLLFLSEELNKNGIAVLRYDKRGVGKSAAAGREEKDLRFDHYVTDAKEWIELLSKDERFSKIIVAGHSEGALIGLLASIENRNVAGYVSIAGTGRPADEILKEQLSSQPDEARNIIYDMIDQLKAGDTLTNVHPAYYTLFRPSVQPYIISWFKYDPAQEIKKVTVPALILQGTTDIQVTEADAGMLAESKPDAKLVIIEGMNHVLKDCDTKDQVKQMGIYQDEKLPVNEQLVKSMVEFILR